MKQIAIPARSVSDPSRSYTCTGLGDRIHTVTIGWAYSQSHGPVTLHLTADKMTGGQFGNKPESWKEIVGLLPAGQVRLRSHAVSPATETEWLAYLGDEVETYHYGDYPGKHEAKVGFDVSQYLKHIPRLAAKPQEIELPRWFVTVQWDAGGSSRRIDKANRVADEYRRRGYEVVMVGGEATGDLRWSLPHIAYAMSKAAHHVGVDSAFLHMAQLYMPCDSIHLYGNPLSHHAKRAVDNGARLNPYL